MKLIMFTDSKTHKTFVLDQVRIKKEINSGVYPFSIANKWLTNPEKKQLLRTVNKFDVGFNGVGIVYDRKDEKLVKERTFSKEMSMKLDTKIALPKLTEDQLLHIRLEKRLKAMLDSL